MNYSIILLFYPDINQHDQFNSFPSKLLSKQMKTEFFSLITTFKSDHFHNSEIRMYAIPMLFIKLLSENFNVRDVCDI